MSERTKNIFRQYYAVIVTIMFFGAMVSLFFMEIPEKNRAIVDMCIGALVRDFINIITYYFNEKDTKTERDEE